MEKCKVEGKIITACKTLEASCEYGHPKGKQKGQYCWSLTDMKTGNESRRLFGIKSGDHIQKGIIYNFCPFCGTDLTGAQVT
jgi:hypothetical protein